MKLAVVIISVLAAASSQVFGYSVDIEIQKRISNEISQTNNELGKIQLPTVMKANYKIQVNGTLNIEHDMFSVRLPENGRSEHCHIMHHFKKNKIFVSPSPKDTDPWIDYEILTKTNVYDFSLILEARSVNNSELFEVSYEIIGNDEIVGLRCCVNFVDLTDIVFEEGVLSLYSIMFKFP